MFWNSTPSIFKALCSCETVPLCALELPRLNYEAYLIARIAGTKSIALYAVSHNRASSIMAQWATAGSTWKDAL